MTEQQESTDNGLGALAARQQRRRGTTRRQAAMPPSRHPRTEPSTDPEENSPTPTPAEGAAEARSAEGTEQTTASPAPVSPDEPVAPQDAPAPAQAEPVPAVPAPVAVAPEPVVPASSPAAEGGRPDAVRARRTPSIEVYLPDDELTEWINQVEDEGFAQRQRAILSPVVRLALNRLRAEMTPEEVVKEVLRNAPPPTGRRGRPRL